MAFMGMPVRLLLLFSALLLTTWGPVAARAAQDSVAVLPFQLHTPAEMNYLRDGLRDMLSSRITAETGTTVLARATVDESLRALGGSVAAERLPELARRLGARHLIYGSVTSLGDGLSIDAKVFAASAAGPEAVRSFYATAPDGKAVMRAIDTLAWDIIEQVYGKKRPAHLAAAAATGPTGAANPFQTTHPEKSFLAAGGDFGGRGGRGFVKTRNLDFSLQAMAVADINNDGSDELLLAAPTELRIFSRDGGRINQIAAAAVPVRYRIHHIGTADLNGNGLPEIYLSAADYQGPSSRVLEWDGKQLVTLADNVPWYLRPMQVPGEGVILAGQGSTFQRAVDGPVYRLERNGDSYASQERLKLPEGVKLFDFAYADLDGDGKKEVVSINKSNALSVIRTDNKILWRSDEHFNATKRTLGGEPPINFTRNQQNNTSSDSGGDRYAEFMVPSRILVVDMDKDGKDEIIVNQLPASIVAVMPRLADYPSGTIMGLKWNGLALEEMWRTRRIDSSVVEFQLKSQGMALKPGQKDELLVGVLLRSGMMDFLTEDESTVLIYPFEFEQPEEKK
ncbi:MAG: hypothetical protein BWK76_04415 [Desulfobulbaceae bacterium A2]|nr:MAG: hypothetical protein BWK76_04415 [Desulfobulbaceae bacterium A2]